MDSKDDKHQCIRERGLKIDERSRQLRSTSFKAYVVVLVAIVATSSAAILIRFALDQNMPPLLIVAARLLIASLALLVLMASYLLAAPSELAASSDTPAGPWVALVGALAASAGSVGWIRRSPHVAARPLSTRIRWGSVGAAVFAVLVFAVGAVSVWSFDERGEVVVTPAVRAQLDELEARAEANPEDAGVSSLGMAALRDGLKADFRIIIDGVSSKGARLGIWTLVAGLAGLAAALPAAGVLGRDEHRQWRWSAITAGIGAGAACVAFGWIFTQVRSADPDYVSGIGAFLAMAAGLVLAAAAAAVIKEFGRAKIYADEVAALAEESRP